MRQNKLIRDTEYSLAKSWSDGKIIEPEFLAGFSFCQRRKADDLQ